MPADLSRSLTVRWLIPMHVARRREVAIQTEAMNRCLRAASLMSLS